MAVPHHDGDLDLRAGAVLPADPSLVGIGRYTLTAELPASGGLYETANVTYRGITIGKVTDVEPTRSGAKATMSIDSRYKIPIDAVADVHSVSAVGEQYLDLVSNGDPGKYLADGATITKGTVPSEIGPALDTANAGLAALPKEKIAHCSTRRLSQSVAWVRRCNAWSTPRRRSSATSRPRSPTSTTSSRTPDRSWTARSVGRQHRALGAKPEHPGRADCAGGRASAKRSEPGGAHRRSGQRGVQRRRESLPQALANLEVVFDLLKRYHTGLEQVLVFLPQGGSIAQTVAAPFPN